MANKVTNDLFALEAELKKLNHVSELHATIYADNKGELMDAANYCNCHLFQPFEKDDINDFYYFDYHLPNNKNVYITVRSKAQYRKKIAVEEI